MGSDTSFGSWVMVVEDDSDIRRMIALALELEGYRVVEAANGTAALRRLRDGPRPGVILLDLMMPGMNGWEFRTAQVGDPALADIPVVVISGDDRVREKASELQARDYLKKPVDLDSLLDTVGRNLG